ncbi:MAG: twin-arginine translocase TatA/TatE family subunit [Solirubrobacteraceae bacterium]
MVGLDNPLHILMLLVVILLVFGAKRLPEMGRSLGSGLRGFKETISGEMPSEQSPQLAMGMDQQPVSADLAQAGSAEPAAAESVLATSSQSQA